MLWTDLAFLQPTFGLHDGRLVVQLRQVSTTLGGNLHESKLANVYGQNGGALMFILPIHAHKSEILYFSQ